MKPKPNLTLLGRNKKCIINTDIDGILSGIILHNILNWQIVGFCDSGEYIWLDKSLKRNLNEVVFIDMFVAPSHLKCIDQHIVSYDNTANKLISVNKNKLNPNLIESRTLIPANSYSNKYPFGTVHFIVAVLESMSYNINIDLFKETISGLKLIDLFLRADDTMLTSTYSNYVINAENWWKWLIDLSCKGITSQLFYEHIKWAKTFMWKSQIELQKRKLANLLMSSPFFCSRPDGGYKGIKELGKIQLKRHVKEYIYFIAETSGLKCFNLDFEMDIIRGKAYRRTYSDNLFKEINSIENGILFSYAFVRSSFRNKNFSYTIMPKQ